MYNREKAAIQAFYALVRKKTPIISASALTVLSLHRFAALINFIAHRALHSCAVPPARSHVN